MLNRFVILYFSLSFILFTSLFSMRGPYYNNFNQNRYRSYSPPFYNRSNNTSEQKLQFEGVENEDESNRSNYRFGTPSRFEYQNRPQATYAPQRDMNKGMQGNKKSLIVKPDSIQSKVQKELEESGQKDFKVSIDSSSGTATVKKGNVSMECNPSQKGDCLAAAKELQANFRNDDKK